MKIITLTGKKFNEYAKTHKYRSYYQTTEYGHLMKTDGFEYHMLGFINNSNELIGATMILFKKGILNYKIAYAPYGFLLDYTNSDLIDELTEKLKLLLHKQKFIYLKINPKVECSKRDKTGRLISYNPEINNIMEILQKNDYIHQGFNNYFEDLKPRYNAILELNKDTDILYKNLNKQIRNKINKAEKCGIEIKEMDKTNKDDVNTFFQFIKRKHTRPLKYYQTLLKEYEDSKIYIAVLNTKKYLKNSKDNYENELLENEKINEKLQRLNSYSNSRSKMITKKMESDKTLEINHNHLIKANRLFNRYPDNIIVAGMLVIENKDGSDLIIEGFNKKYKDLDPNYLLKWEYIKKINKKKKYFNMNGIVGEFIGKNKYSGLNESKLGFNADAIEYIGEFDLVINKIMYKFYKRKQKKKQS